jgi:hypothetical protein
MIIRSKIVRVLAVAGLASPAGLIAQSTTSLLPDAATLPRGAVRLRALTSWTRYDALFGALGTSGGTASPLAASLNADSLGPDQVPGLAVSQNAIRTLAALPAFRLTAGKLTAAANSRIVTAPLIAEYGLTSRLTLSAQIALVETRSTVQAELNHTVGLANVGPNPAAAGNAVVAQQLQTAATALQQQLSSCAQAPAQPQCARTAGRTTEAQTLVKTATDFANATSFLYGGASGGQPFVPIRGDAIQQAIDARLATMAQQFQTFLGSSTVTATLTGAGGPPALRQLQSFLTSERVGRDTLASTDRAGLGDASIGATYQLVNHFGDSTPGFHYRAALNGTLRLGTGQPTGTNRFFDLGTGTGQLGVEIGGAADLLFNRKWSATTAASYTHQFGSIAVARVPNPGHTAFPLGLGVPGTVSAGDVFALAALPRYRIAPFFSFNGMYAFQRVGAETVSPVSVAGVDFPAGVFPISSSSGLRSATAHQLGLGFAYSTAGTADRAPGRLPIEVSFSHLETIRGDGGPIPKSFRDQVELRVFFPR